MVALIKMLNREMEDEKVDDIVDDILEKVDANGDGVISQQEFVHHIERDHRVGNKVQSLVGTIQT